MKAAEVMRTACIYLVSVILQRLPMSKQRGNGTAPWTHTGFRGVLALMGNAYNEILEHQATFRRCIVNLPSEWGIILPMFAWRRIRPYFKLEICPHGLVSPPQVTNQEKPLTGWWRFEPRADRPAAHQFVLSCELCDPPVMMHNGGTDLVWSV